MAKGGVDIKKAFAPDPTTGVGFNVDPSTGAYLGQGTGTAQGGEAIIPALADEIVKFIRQQSYMRQFFEEVRMPTLELLYPRFTRGLPAYFVGEAAVIPFDNAAFDQVRLTAKKIGLAITVSSELSEDQLVPIIPALIEDMAKAFALHEEIAFLYGNTDPTTIISGSTYWGPQFNGGQARQASADNTNPHNPTTNPTGAFDGNWFQNDVRLMFDGISVISETAGAPKVDAAGQPLSIAHVNEALYKLDIFGRNPSQLLLVVSLRDYATLRQDPYVLTTLHKFGPQAVFLTGALESVYGVPVVATNIIPTTMGTVYDWASGPGTSGFGQVVTQGNLSEAFVVSSAAFIIGDRRDLTIRASEIPFMISDSVLVVATERIAFAARYPQAVCKIENIGPLA